VSNLVTISILQSLVIRCLSLLFSIIHHYRILSHNELKFVAHIFQIFRWVNAHLLIYGLYKLGLFWILKIIPNSSPRKISIQIIPNGEIRNNLSFNLFGFTCFDFLCKILKSENETQASDCMIIGYCEPLGLMSMVTYYGYICNWIMETNAFLEIFSS
jgi:hypothetical protein